MPKWTSCLAEIVSSQHRVNAIFRQTNDFQTSHSQTTDLSLVFEVLSKYWAVKDKTNEWRNSTFSMKPLRQRNIRWLQLYSALVLQCDLSQDSLVLWFHWEKNEKLEATVALEANDGSWSDGGEIKFSDCFEYLIEHT